MKLPVVYDFAAAVDPLRAKSGYDYLLSFDPNVFHMLAPLFSSFLLPFGVVVLFLVCFVCGLVWNYLGSHHFTLSYPHINQIKRYKLTLWVVQLVASIWCLYLLFTVLDPCVFVHGSLFSGRLTGEITKEWSERLAWLNSLESVWTFVNWGVMPSMFVYIFELLPIGSQSPRMPIHSHHLVVILSVFTASKYSSPHSKLVGSRWG